MHVIIASALLYVMTSWNYCNLRRLHRTVVQYCTAQGGAGQGRSGQGRVGQGTAGQCSAVHYSIVQYCIKTMGTASFWFNGNFVLSLSSTVRKPYGTSSRDEFPFSVMCSCINKLLFCFLFPQNKIVDVEGTKVKLQVRMERFMCKCQICAVVTYNTGAELR